MALSRLNASVVNVAEEHGVLTVGFADHADSPVHWLILQRTLKATKQDHALGEDQVHIATDVNSAGLYGVSGATVSAHEVRLRLTNDASRHLRCDQELIVGLNGARFDYLRLANALRQALHPYQVCTAEL